LLLAAAPAALSILLGLELCCQSGLLCCQPGLLLPRFILLLLTLQLL
jgi:hypothetical protein